MKRRWWEPNPETIIEDLLAAASNKRQRGDPATLADMERLRLGRVAAKSRRVAVKRAELDAEQKAARAWRRPAVPIADKMLQAMSPGEWYGAADLQRAVQCGRRGRAKLEQVMVPRGWVTRAANPRWDPAAVVTGRATEPKWLYRLTDVGEARKGASTCEHRSHVGQAQDG